MNRNTDAEQKALRLEQTLDNFDPAVRRNSLKALHDGLRAFQIAFRDPKPIANMHCHTFFSYNCYGYSPTHFAWLARRAGLEAAGIVDFDVLDGVAEFREAGRLLGLKTCAGVESRVYVPEFADKVINSPGEPGIAYHMGVGFTTSRLSDKAGDFLKAMRKTVEGRNRSLVQRVNKYLKPLELDYDRDVLPLTPSGNPTERHICLAYARKAAQHFKTAAELAKFWTEKLAETADKFDLPAGPKLQGLIRSKTMKQGGVGYVLPDKGSFPKLADMNRFALEAGAIPMITWLDGTSAGEQKMEERIKVACATGAAALNTIPDRNYKPGVKDRKLQNLYDVVKLAEQHGLPVIAGTEMNSPGQKFVDAFESSELSPVAPVFLRGARIVYAHSALQARAGMGYLSKWAKKRFGAAEEKNEFFAELGRRLQPAREATIGAANDGMSPGQVLELAGK